MKKIVIAAASTVALVMAASVSLAGSSPVRGGRPWTIIFEENNLTVYKVCDRGNAIYIARGRMNDSGHSISVVPMSPECDQ